MTKSDSNNVDPSVTRSYVYDSNQLLCKTVEPETGGTIQSWNSAGTLAWRSGGTTLTSTTTCDQASVTAAQKISFGYDVRNRLTSTTYGDGSPSISRSYTADGLPYQTTSNSTTWTYTYNNHRLPTRESMSYSVPVLPQVFNISWGYDANAHVSQLTYPDSSVVAFSPNALGEDTQVGSYATAITRFPNGAVKSYTYGNTIGHTLTQNTRGLPLEMSDGAMVNDLYTYDRNANVTAIADKLADSGLTSRTMTYDGLNRLKSANGIWGTGTYTYDVQDNMLTSVVGSRSLTFSYDAHNRLSGSTGSVVATYGYDVNGNMTKRNTQAYVFDLGNRATQATGVSTYTYDGEGRRINIAHPDGSSQRQIYDQAGQLLYAEGLQGTTYTSYTKYIYLGNKLIAEDDSVGGIEYSHTDALGSPVARTNASGGLISQTRFEPYGNVASGFVPTPPNSVGFTGHVNDSDTGLVYMQQRYYDPIAGRLMSVDPVVADTGSGASFNRYEYADSSPYRYIDPDGQDSVKAHAFGGDAPDSIYAVTYGSMVGSTQGAPAAAAYTPASAAGAPSPNPIAKPFNRDEYYQAIFMAAMLAVPVLGGEVDLGILEAEGIGARVEAVHGALDPIAAGRRTTAALDTVEGTRVLATGGRDLSPAQRALMAPGEVAAKLPGAHAEVTALQHAAQNGLTPAQMAVSRTICASCRADIEQSGGQLTSPTTAIWPR